MMLRSGGVRVLDADDTRALALFDAAITIIMSAGDVVAAVGVVIVAVVRLLWIVAALLLLLPHHHGVECGGWVVNVAYLVLWC